MLSPAAPAAAAAPAQRPAVAAPRPAAPAATPPAAAAPAPGAAAPGTPGGPDITVTGRSQPIVPLAGGRTFLSPMGEPYHSPDKVSGAERWFLAVDADHDRRITKAEFRADALRFFATLDTDHDGELGPVELDHYEQDIAPEVRVRTYAPVNVTRDEDGNVKQDPYPDRQGAGRYTYLAMPEPVIYADTNMDRAVTRDEFLRAADQRFKMLDANGDGVLTRSDLPRLATPRNDEDF